MRRLLSLGLVVGVVAAGCGGGGETSKEDYGKELGKAAAKADQTLADIPSEAGQDTSPKEAGDRLERSAAALDDAAKRMDGVDPPADAKAAHRELVDGLHELAGVLRKSATAARNNDAAGLAKTLQDPAAGDAFKKIADARKELEAKGIKVTTSAGG
jgi:hypothetical protein